MSTATINSEQNVEPSKPLAVSLENTRHLTSLGRSTITELIDQGRLTTVTIGRRRLVLYASIEALLAGA